MTKAVDMLEQARARINAANPDDTYLDLSNCGISNLYDLPELAQMPRLEHLNLDSNIIQGEGLKSVPEVLKGLKVLNLTNNRINDVGAEMIAKSFSLLKSLILGNNQIGDEGLFALSNLKSLQTLVLAENIFSGRGLYIIAESFTRLTWLDVSKNQLTDEMLNVLAPAIPKLTHLNLAYNRISDVGIMNFAKDCAGLKTLDVWENQIGDQGAYTIAQYMLKLESLNLGLNQLGPEGAHALAQSLKNLTHLDLYKNNVGSKSAISIALSLHKLTSLNIDYANIGENGCTYIAHNLKELKSLRVGGNQLGDESALALANSQRQLTDLDIRENNISQTGFDAIINELKALKSLNISNNQVSNVYPITNHPHLEFINLFNNPISDCPPDVWQTNDVSILRSYFSQIDYQLKVTKNVIPDDAEPFTTKTKNPVIDRTDHFKRKRDVKLILLGNSNAGKTTLVQMLKHGKFSTKRISTHGLDVVRWEPDAKRFPLLKDVTVSIWDFGGQDYYHEGYKVFLSRNALFLVVWSKDNDNNCYKKELMNSETGLEEEIAHYEKSYWLNTVRFYGGYDPQAIAYLVQTKTDLDGNERERIGEHLHKEFIITESFALGLKKATEEGDTKEQRLYEQFITELEKVLNDLAGSSEIPDAWLKIRKEIWQIGRQKNNPFKRKMKDKQWLTMDEFADTCVEITNGEISKENSISLPVWLERGGTVLLFQKNEYLKNKIFLEPGALAEKIYNYFNEDVRKKNGELEFHANSENDTAIRALLLDLKLIVEHPDPAKAGIFVVPQYLPDKHPVEYIFRIAPKDAWKASMWFKVPMFYYKRVLNSLLFHYASPESIDTPTFFWKHAVIFVRNGLRVMIKGLYPTEADEGIIQISIEQGEKKKMLEREIFLLIRKNIVQENWMMETTDTPSPSSNTDETIEKNRKRIDIHIKPQDTHIFKPWLYVSADGKYFIDVDELPTSAADLVEGKIRVSGKYYPASEFASILDFEIGATKKIFLSYSHQNTQWLNRLRVHLSGLKRSKFIEEWTDKEILPGEKWDEKIKEQIAKADIFILLLSADFVASRYIWETELPSIREKIQHNGGHIIYVLTEPFDIGAVGDIGSAELIPKDKNEQLKAVSLWDNKEEALETVAKRIREWIEKTNLKST